MSLRRLEAGAAVQMTRTLLLTLLQQWAEAETDACEVDYVVSPGSSLLPLGGAYFPDFFFFFFHNINIYCFI